MNLAYTEISNEEADRIIKSANLKTLATMVAHAPLSDWRKTAAFAKSILSN